MVYVIKLKKCLSVVFAFACMFSLIACSAESTSHRITESSRPVNQNDELELENGRVVVCDEDLDGAVAITAELEYVKCDEGEWIHIRKSEALKADFILGEDEEDDESSSSQKKSSSSKSVFSDDIEESSSSKTIENDSSTVDSKTSSSSLASTIENDKSSSSIFQQSSSQSSSLLSSSSQSSSMEVEDSSSSLADVALSSSEESVDVVSVIKPAGYYESHCPSGVRCVYVNTGYLNPEIEYGDFLDLRDGLVYKTVAIGSQIWLAQNLNFNSNHVDDLGDEVVNSWCFSNSNEKCEAWGRLYLWSAAMDSSGYVNSTGAGVGCGQYSEYDCSNVGVVQGICPEGWHLPSSDEWTTLIDYVENDGGDYAGTLLKIADGWDGSSVADGKDAYGFSAVSVGGYDPASDYFHAVGEFTDFWSSTESNDNYAYYVSINYSYENLRQGTLAKNHGRSVRCVKDSE